jgi:CheY-like chemotaxis protein
MEPLALLVEPDPDTQLLYHEYLTSKRWQTITSATGPEALVKVIAGRPDVIVSEVRLPGFDGVALCELLKSDPETSRIPFLFLTADAVAASVARAESAGADVLTKPCLPHDLFIRMRLLLERSRRVFERSAEVISTAERNVAMAQAVRAQVAEKRRTLKNALQRGDTVTPPALPPPLCCPTCYAPLRYLRSHIGGVSVKNPEQWDLLECGYGCGRYEYRPRTRRLRRVAE